MGAHGWFQSLVLMETTDKAHDVFTIVTPKGQFLHIFTHLLTKHRKNCLESGPGSSVRLSLDPGPPQNPQRTSKFDMNT